MYQHLHFETLESTNAYVQSHQDRLGGFSFVSCDHQTAGIGRLGRTWYDEAKQNLMFSLLIKDPKVLSYGPKVSLFVAYALCLTLQRLEGLPSLSIKWPNDIYLGSMKVCGILLQGRLPEYLIVGVGLNVNQTSFQGEYRIPPTSLALELGHKLDLEALRDELFRRVYQVLRHIKDRQKPAFSYFNSHDYLAGKVVTLQVGEADYSGVCCGIDDAFALILDINGEKHRFVSGEVSHVVIP